MTEQTHHSETDPTNIERQSAQRVLEYAEAEMRKTGPSLIRLLQKRHELFNMHSSQLSTELPITEQLYDDPFYNDAFTVPDLRVRTGAAYNKLKESYDPVINSIDAEGHPTPELDDTEDTLQVKKIFRQEILKSAQSLGYVSEYAGKSDDEMDRRLGMLPSTLEKIDRPVSAVIIPGAAGISNLIRTHDALRNIRSGAVDTDTIIFAAGERKAAPHERPAAEKLGFRGGDTEFEQAVTALEDIGGVQFEPETETLPAQYGKETPDSTVLKGQVVINDRVVKVFVVEAAYDRARVDALSGKAADRSITSETYYSILPLLPDSDGPVVVDSHDTWGKGQEIVAQEILGLEAHKEIIGTWAFKDDRVKTAEDGSQDIHMAQAVIDEIGKTHFNLVRLKVAALNKLSSSSSL